MTEVRWTGQDQVKRNMAAYGVAAKRTVWNIGLFWAPQLEAYAKQNRPWTDRTGNARQTLHATVLDLGNGKVAIILSHGVSYGLWLEIKSAGKWAILWPTLHAHIPAISQMLKDIFK